MARLSHGEERWLARPGVLVPQLAWRRSRGRGQGGRRSIRQLEAGGHGARAGHDVDEVDLGDLGGHGWEGASRHVGAREVETVLVARIDAVAATLIQSSRPTSRRVTTKNRSLATVLSDAMAACKDDWTRGSSSPSRSGPLRRSSRRAPSAAVDAAGRRRLRRGRRPSGRRGGRGRRGGGGGRARGAAMADAAKRCSV